MYGLIGCLTCSLDRYYRAVTGDCHPCSWCCSDSKDEDIEKQCSEQTSLPANKICRYDVNTIMCAPAKDSSSAQAMLVPTSGSKDGMAAQRGEGNSTSTLWLIAVVSCLAFDLCALLGVMLVCCYRKQMLSQFACNGCVTGYRKYLQITGPAPWKNAHRSIYYDIAVLIVFKVLRCYQTMLRLEQFSIECRK